MSKAHSLEIDAQPPVRQRPQRRRRRSSVNSVREDRTVEEYDRAPTIWQGSNGGRPYRITSSAVYELPFGRGRAFLNEGGVLAAVVGGWQLAGNLRLPARRAPRTGPTCSSTAI